ncbi:MAG: HAD hydrolase family protein [Sutterellaceae bacterium]|nr:HAD hydrolase family protein [Burkholderiaceae bacterium]MCX7901848.1 HAD hydrolase family protein [Burkholderiaceae bacterium]MDW8430250.1 HAD hydrolase family protein [Sutterellaceae bacterium]
MSPLARAARLRLMAFDVDGVLTDGRLYFGADGEAMKAFHVRDGQGIKLLQAAGIEVALLTARTSPIVARRAQELGIARVWQGQADKWSGLLALCAAVGCAAQDCGYMGDDWPDLPVLTRVGFAAAVADAVPEVKAVAHWVSSCAGGCGAARELAEFVLRAQGRFETLLSQYRDGAHA